MNTDGTFQVLELGSGVGPAYCGWLLTGNGAQVTKAMSPEDRLQRQVGGLMSQVLNRGKTLSANDDATRRTRLAEADLVVEALDWAEYAVLDREFQALVERGGVLVSLSCFGRSGPYRERRGFAVQAMAGSVSYRMGHPERAPLQFACEAADYIAAAAAAAGALAALRVSERDGVGQHVDVATLDVLSNVFNRMGVPQAAAGGDARGSRNGPRLSNGLGGIRECADGWAQYSTLLSKHWERWFEANGRADVLTNPRFALTEDRMEPDARTELEEIQRSFVAHRTRAELFDFFQQVKVPFQPVHTIAEVLEADHLSQRHFWERFEADGVSVKVPASPIRHETRAAQEV